MDVSDSHRLAVAPTHGRGHAHAQVRAQDAVCLSARRSQAGRLPQGCARHRHSRGPAALSAPAGRRGCLADHAERDDLGPEVLLRRHAQPRRTDGQDAARVCAAYAAGGAQPRGGLSLDRGGLEPQAPDGLGGGLRHRVACQRSHRIEGRRHRQPAHDAARRARQGSQGPLCHAAADPAAAAARVVARGPCPRQDFAQRLAVPGPGSHRPAEHAPAQPRHPRRRRRSQDRQARLDAHAAPLFRVREYAERCRRYANDQRHRRRRMVVELGIFRRFTGP